MHARAQFPPEPRSAAAARHWVRDHLNEMGRTELVPCAEAGVSELVTNGILHAQTSIGLQLSHHRERVIIEVYDGSPMSQQSALDTAAPNAVESTIGRGLRIVRANAREWGVSTTQQGKAIWFQPAPSTDSSGLESKAQTSTEAAHADDGGRFEDGARFEDAVQFEDGAPFDLDSALDALAEAFPEVGPDLDGGRVAGDETVQVLLLGVPPMVVQHYRKRWLELVREMHLVALSQPSPQQELAQRFCTAAQTLHNDLYVIERSTGGYSPALSEDGTAVDAVVDVPPSLRQAFVDLRDLARELEAHWAGGRLLFVHPGPQAAQLREWWVGEFIAQIDGEEPTAWPGEMEVHDRGAPSHAGP
jgi:anti-sigma regulatory factor (Ser/Thr protein kinase)